MLERTSEQLVTALAALEGLDLKDRNLVLDTKAQGVGLLTLVNSVMNRPEDEPLPTEAFLATVNDTVQDYVRLVTLLQDEGLK